MAPIAVWWIAAYRLWKGGREEGVDSFDLLTCRARHTGRKNHLMVGSGEETHGKRLLQVICGWLDGTTGQSGRRIDQDYHLVWQKTMTRMSTFEVIMAGQKCFSGRIVKNIQITRQGDFARDCSITD